MELTLDLVKRLRDEGLSWRQIGLFLSDEIAEEPYILQERARSMYRKEFPRGTQAYHFAEKHQNEQRSECGIGDYLDGGAVEPV